MKQLVTLLLAAGLAAAHGTYAEDLQIQPLSRNEVLSTFDFEMTQSLVGGEQQWGLQEFTTFPRSLGQILDQSNARELHLRFGQGFWNAERWGSPPAMGALAGGIGVEVWAWVAGKDAQEAWQNWRQLVHSLGGYFCASINYIDEAQTSFPSAGILAPQGEGVDGAWLLRGSLPAEPICTENLTPFLKLLPCQGKAGVASLLDGHTLFRSQWQTMSVDVCHPHEGTITLHQAVASVMNTDLCKEDPLPWHIDAQNLVCDSSKSWGGDWACYPINPTSAAFSLSQLFGTNLKGQCAIADASKPAVRLLAPENWLLNGSSSTREFTLDRTDSKMLDFVITTEDSGRVHESTRPPLFVDRSFSGWGQQKGGIRTVFSNKLDRPLSVSYVEILPWFMRLYLYTAQTYGNGTLLETKYVPGRDRARPNQLQFSLEIAPGGKYEIEYEFDKSLLYIEEYPPDANHGFEVPPGLAIANTDQGRYEVRTTSLLLSLPVPDFSMPYNVIILTSTVIALVFGTLYNLIIREVADADRQPNSAKPVAAKTD